MLQSTVAPIRRLIPRPADRWRADHSSLEGWGTEKDFIGFAALRPAEFLNRLFQRFFGRDEKT